MVGTVKAGQVVKDQALQLIGFGHVISTLAGGIQRFNEDQTSAVAGDHIGIQIKKVKKEVTKLGELVGLMEREKGHKKKRKVSEANANPMGGRTSRQQG